MPSVLFEALVILLLIILNGIFSMSEIAVVSARKTRLEQWANEGDNRARTALELANAPNQFLATIQIGITLVGILAGVFGGATIATTIAVGLDEIPLVASYSRPVSLAIVVLIITYLSLIIGELVPKRLALNSPERIASTMATPMRALARLASPVVYVLGLSTDAILRLLGMRPVIEPPVTEEEIRSLIAQGTQAGMFEEAEQEMVERVFRLGDRRVGAVMTPRTEIVWVDSEAPLEEIQQTIAQSTHSRILVAQGSLDDVLGVAHAKELLLPLLRGEPLDLTAILRQPLYVPESMRALEVLELFKQSATHIALVIDEYGGVQGLLTPSDILEAIVGDLPQPGEPVEPLAVQREDGSWLLDGMLSIDDFKELFDIGRLPDEDQGVYQTLAGFVIMQLGRIPVVSDHFEWGGLRLEVVDMDGNRVDKVLVHPPADATSEAGAQV
jgi:putative hemolysin